MKKSELKEFLDERVAYYNHPRFIETDPIQVPHQFKQKEDIEIAGFLAATIAWGNRKSIIKNADKMMKLMGNSPYDFVMGHHENQLENLLPFVHRTFNGHDFIQFVKSLQHIYLNRGGMETLFKEHATNTSMQPAIAKFKEVFFEMEHLPRTQKHISNPLKGSSAKRINMFLRWMVRNDNCGVDLGIWKDISPALLSCPLDVHSGNVARKLGLLKRKQNDAKALAELDNNLRKLDALDPVKYDFALFGLGVFEGF
ncbi:TIGR02757 family protein [Galbibacter pacificus]|uniref:TIGR02757 family protein n=1 Tax=Galbibacter pacificus TaxID=2996052 RepID=A0ABT6FQM1_9FLAO|nr:TIGR02757 family protein [Galbibacter pacificus]MDG3582128.1 TIGR02757 family protein [Galbibacter pacificus]MDG3585396.1 TIGR02757 family protein [Galbibacter pacificus]